MPDIGWLLLLTVCGLVALAVLIAVEPRLLLVQRSLAAGDDPPTAAPDAQALTTPAPSPLALKPHHIWLAALNDLPDDIPHLFIYGPSGSGKTVFARYLIEHRRDLVVVLDPKWQRGKWGGVPTYTIDDLGNYDPINLGASHLRAEFRQRLRLHRDGQRAAPLTIVIDELPDLIAECPEVRSLLIAVLRMGRELNMRLIALATGRGVEDLGLKGRGDLRQNLTDIRLGSAAVERCAALSRHPRPTLVELRGSSIPLDVSRVTASNAPIALPRRWSAPAAALPPAPPTESGTGVSAAAPEQPTPAPEHPETTPESAEKAAESPETAERGSISAVEKAMIQGAIRAGKGKTETLQALKGYSGRKNRLYSRIWDELSATAPATTSRQPAGATR